MIQALADKEPTAGGSAVGANTGDAFNPKSYCSYTVDPAANIPTILSNGAGAGKIVP